MTEDPGDASAPSSPAETDDLRARLAAAQAQASACEARERAMRGELQHRTLNLLAVVRSIFARSVAAGGDLDAVADHFTGRLDVLARYQRARGPAPNSAFDFEAMVHDELQSVLASGDPRITCEGPEVHVPQEIAQLLGLALHELVTNSIKFGALSLPPDRGTLAIRWRRMPEAFHLAWNERGMAVLGAAPLRQGFGRTFIEQALPYQLGATTLMQIRPGTVSCDIRVPLWDKAGNDSENPVGG